MRWNVIRPSLTAATMPASPGFGQHHAGGRFGDIGCRRDRDADLRLAQRRRVVGAVAAHADGVAALLERLDELVLVLRQDAGEDRELLGMDAVGDRSGRTDGAVEPHRARHDGGGRRRVARHHHGAHAQAMQFRDERGRVRARRVAERDESGQLQRRRRSGRDRQHAETLPLELLRRCRRGRRRLREADDRGKGALHDTLRCPGRISCGRLGHLLRRIERHEFDQLRRIGNRLARRGGANRAIDRILPAIGTGQRGQRQNMRLVEAGHRMNGRHRQRVLGQRAGLVGAQDIRRSRFIHRGQAGRKDAQLCQGPRAERRRKGEGGRQRDRYRCQDRGQDEGNDLGERHLEKAGIGDQHHDDDAVEHGEIAHHAQHRLLLRADDMGGAHELRGAAELGARSGRRDLRHRLAAPYQRSGEGLDARAGFDGNRFAGEHGLVEQDFSPGECHIRRDHAAERQLHHVARHQLGGGDRSSRRRRAGRTRSARAATSARQGLPGRGSPGTARARH